MVKSSTNCLLGLFSTLTLISLSKSFMVQTNKGYNKCFYTDVSHQKTLDVRFGFPRKQPQNCAFKLQIDYIAEKQNRGVSYDHKLKQGDINLYNGIFYCYDMNPRQNFAYKHTPGQSEYSGQYRICVSNLQDFNQANKTMFQLQIIQKFDPTYMADMINVPLVGSTQLMELEEVVTSIKRILSWCQEHVKQAEDFGDRLVKVMEEANDKNYKATYLQLVFLIIYGVSWVVLVLGLLK